MKPSRSRIAGLLVVVMVSAGGLSTFGLLSLRRTAEDAQGTAQVEARAAAEALGRAESSEFVEGDRPAAIGSLIAAAETLSAPDEKAFLLLRAAWGAQRRGLAAKRDLLLDQIGGETLTDPRLRRSALILRAIREGALPDDGAKNLSRRDPVAARAYLARLAAHGVGGLEAPRREIQTIEDRRRRLRAADDVLRSGLADGTPLLASREGFLVLLFPGAKGGGRGAAARPEDAIRWAGLEADRFAVGDDATASDGVQAAPLIAVLPRRGTTASPWTDSR